MARAIVGDKSDNLDGIKGVGLPTVAKRLPFLIEEKTYMVGDIIEYCENSDLNLRAYENIIDGEEVIKENYKLMQLYSPSISVQSKQKIKYVVRNTTLDFNKTLTDGMMLEDGIGNTSWLDLFITFKKIIMGARG